MDFRLFQTFIEVVNCGSFTQAAKQLNYGQSTVSQHIAQLEAHYKEPLFDRIGKKVFLTPLGEQVYTASLNLDKAYGELLALSLQYGQHHILRIGVYESLLHYRIQQLIQNFKQARPHLELIVRHGTCVELREMVRTGQLDLAFQIEPDRTFGDLNTLKLVKEPFALIFPKSEGPKLMGDPRATIYMTEQTCTYRKAFEMILDQNGIARQHVMETGSVEVIKQYVSCGLGYALVPEITVRDAQSTEKLHVTPAEVDEALYTQIFWHKNKAMTSVMAEFIDALKAISQTWY